MIANKKFGTSKKFYKQGTIMEIKSLIMILNLLLPICYAKVDHISNVSKCFPVLSISNSSGCLLLNCGHGGPFNGAVKLNLRRKVRYIKKVRK